MRALGGTRRVAKYAVVGGLGFAVDGGVLSLLTHAFGMDPFIARLISFALALTATWLLNRGWTFADRAERPPAQAARYVAVQVTGGLANYLCYAGLLLAIPALQQLPIIALAFGSAVGLVVNYAGALLFVFPEKRGG